MLESVALFLFDRLSLALAWTAVPGGVRTAQPVPQCMARRAVAALRAAGYSASWASDPEAPSSTAYLTVRTAGSR
jgi:hypothetical protein